MSFFGLLFRMNGFRMEGSGIGTLGLRLVRLASYAGTGALRPPAPLQLKSLLRVPDKGFRVLGFGLGFSCVVVSAAGSLLRLLTYWSYKFACLCVYAPKSLNP